MGPARNFTESLTPDPELENSLDPKPTFVELCKAATGGQQTALPGCQ